MKPIKIRFTAIAAVAAGSAFALLLYGCSTITKTGEPQARVEKAGAQLWAENCNRCHNLRSPDSYSATQWEVAMLHMRVRANLTPDEHKKILEFLKSAN